MSKIICGRQAILEDSTNKCDPVWILKTSGSEIYSMSIRKNNEKTRQLRNSASQIRSAAEQLSEAVF